MTKLEKKKSLAKQGPSPADLRSKMITDAVFIALAIIFSWNMTHLFTINFFTFLLICFVTIIVWMQHHGSRIFRLGRILEMLFCVPFLFLFIFINYGAIFIIANNFKETTLSLSFTEIAPYLSAVWVGIAIAVTEKIIFYYKESKVLSEEKFFIKMFTRIFVRTFGLMAVLWAAYMTYSFTGFSGNGVVITLLAGKLYYDFIMYKRATI